MYMFVLLRCYNFGSHSGNNHVRSKWNGSNPDGELLMKIHKGENDLRNWITILKGFKEWFCQN
jgi:hypothetical protein